MKTGRRPFRIAACSIALGLAADAADAQPDAFWCGTQLVREGMAATEITRRCGEPNSVERVEEPIFAFHPNGTRNQVGVRVIQIWTYDRGSGRFPARIEIEDGVATEVELVRR